METKKIVKPLLFLDDLRNPYEDEWIEKYAPDFLYGDNNIVWVKNYDDFVAWIKENGLPDKISFDHDLATVENTGYDACEWVVDYCIDKGLEFPKWVVQSANPVGAKNISSLIINFINHSEIARTAPPL